MEVWVWESGRAEARKSEESSREEEGWDVGWGKSEERSRESGSWRVGRGGVPGSQAAIHEFGGSIKTGGFSSIVPTLFPPMFL